MERVMTVEEKIRRAEEIYQRRKQGEMKSVAKVSVRNKKDIKILRKMVIQIIICIVIYLIVYAIQNNNYVFSNDFINKVNALLSYDTNFIELYGMIKNQVVNIIKQESEEEKKEELNAVEEQSNNEAIGGAEAETKQDKKSLSQEEIDIQNIKSTCTFIKPLEGTISSEYGRRDTATGNIPKNHTGIDIAADLGSKIKSATDGEVVLASEEGDYRKTFKNSNWRS